MIKVKNHAFQIYSLTFRLKTLREVTFLTDSGNYVHFGELLLFLTEKSWVKLFECQAEVFGWLTQT